MRKGLLGPIVVLAAAVAVLSLAPTPAAGQGAIVGAGAERWDPPRTPDGQPDLQGIWGPNAAGHSLEEGPDPANANVGQGAAVVNPEPPNVIVDPTPEGKIPYQPWAVEQRNENLRNIFAPAQPEHVEPEDRCLPNGVPRSNLRGQMQITQGPGYVLILHEWIHAYRFISLDGRPHVPSSVRLWNGDSRGRWEGDTLVVDVTNFTSDGETFNKQPWLDGHGSFYSDALHVVERWTLADANTINYEATIEDPNVFTRPWTLAFTISRNRDPDYQFFEVACYEGHRTELQVGAGRRARAEGQTGIHEHVPGFYGGR